MTQIILTVDLGFGDAGKGSVVDALTRRYEAHTVVRFNGGAQAAHRVVEAGPASREHVFSQFGSGTLAGATTHLSRFMLVDPPALLAEAAHLQAIGVPAPLAQVNIDTDAVIVTPYQRAINRLRELARGTGRHGSCGMGVGEAAQDALAANDQVLRAGDMLHPDRLRERLRWLRDYNCAKLAALRPLLPDSAQARDELAVFDDAELENWFCECAEVAGTAQIVGGEHLGRLLNRPGCVVFEAAQGVLLDEWRGFHPYTTWSTTTLQNAETLLREARYHGHVTRLGITRAYTTRHGAGPLPSEDATLTAALPDARNGTGAWQGGFRSGWLDLVLLRYACAVVGQLDGLALTCLDRAAALPALHICTQYQDGTTAVPQLAPAQSPHDLTHQEQLTTRLLRVRPQLAPLANTDHLIAHVERTLGLPVLLQSYGPTAAKKDMGKLRGWNSDYCATTTAAG
ncbi:MAG: adenylosuccinate synthetase [Roseiflexaceae bacterium]|nr:adenylosuccinate synthetase [Roseiflexaceae bacterium]